MTEEWVRHPDFEIYEGPHEPTPTHGCRIEGWHAHAVGHWESYFRLNDMAMMSEEEPIVQLVEENNITRAVFAGDDCPLCEIVKSTRDILIRVLEEFNRVCKN